MKTDTSLTVTFERCYPLGLPPASYPAGTTDAGRFAAEPLATAEILCMPRQPAYTACLPPINRLQPGSTADYRTADDLVNASQGRLVWAKDRHDDWWVVRREDRRHVEHARHGYRGQGLHYGNGEAPVSQCPVNLDDISTCVAPVGRFAAGGPAPRCSCGLARRARPTWGSSWSTRAVRDCRGARMVAATGGSCCAATAMRWSAACAAESPSAAVACGCSIAACAACPSANRASTG